jgi:hypothetical protein
MMHTIDSPQYHPTAVKSAPRRCAAHQSALRNRLPDIKQEWRGGAKVRKK